MSGEVSMNVSVNASADVNANVNVNVNVHFISVHFRYTCRMLTHPGHLEWYDGYIGDAF